MKRMLPWLITILLSITLIAIVAVFLYNQFLNPTSANPTEQALSSVQDIKPNQLTADKRVELTSEVTGVKTNLSDLDFIVVMSFAFQLDSKSTKEDFEKIKEIEIKPIIVRTLADATAEEMQGSKGKDELSARLLNRINPILPEGGKVTKVDITEFIIQRL
ncbi:flagellar basal body-associated FliL family protein [Paenibacillus sp. 1P07SE]|uniref:flagellar basal body-associated FliL family protein n=1 Tax=Paenibacillus sp. 1P07SE TaxID=3132209 RepID=UPI0039A5B4CE